MDHAAAVKKYRRAAAGKDPEIFPEDIRPPAVLKVELLNVLLNYVFEGVSCMMFFVFNEYFPLTFDTDNHGLSHDQNFGTKRSRIC